MNLMETRNGRDQERRGSGVGIEMGDEVRRAADDAKELSAGQIEHAF